MLTVVEAGRSIWVLIWDMCGSENKKGPPCGEPFLILRMVPAPDERYVSARLGFSGVWSSLENSAYPN